MYINANDIFTDTSCRYWSIYCSVIVAILFLIIFILSSILILFNQENEENRITIIDFIICINNRSWRYHIVSCACYHDTLSSVRHSISIIALLRYEMDASQHLYLNIFLTNNVKKKHARDWYPFKVLQGFFDRSFLS